MTNSMVQIATPSVPPQMYRNFAVLTVAATLLIALIADGENREAVADRMEQHESDIRSQRLAAARNAKPQLQRRDATASNGRFDGGDTADFGTPTVRMHSRNFRSSVLPPELTSTRTGETLVIPGYSRAYLDSLTEEQYRRLVASLEEAGTFSAETRAANKANLERLSRQRSGQATTEDTLAR